MLFIFNLAPTTCSQDLSRRLDQEKAGLCRIDDERRQFLHLAVAHLVRCLWIQERKSVEHMFQLCSYWLQNTDDERVTELVSNGWASIASANFIPLFYQLAARYAKQERRGALREHGNTARS